MSNEDRRFDRIRKKAPAKKAPPSPTPSLDRYGQYRPEDQRFGGRQDPRGGIYGDQTAWWENEIMSNPAFAASLGMPDFTSQWGRFRDDPEIWEEIIGHFRGTLSEEGLFHNVQSILEARHGTGGASRGPAGFRGGGGGGGGGMTREQRIDGLVAIINDRAATFGVQMTMQQILDLATTGVDKNWNDSQIIDGILLGVNWEDLAQGEITGLADRVGEIAAQYMVGASEETKRDMAMRMALGELNVEGVESTFREHAKARFGWMAAQIEQGVKPRDFFAPTRDVIARTLEMAPEQIDMMDERWMGLLEVVDENTGTTRGATMNEALMAARRQDEWVNTQNAQHTMAGMAVGLAEAFGRR